MAAPAVSTARAFDVVILGGGPAGCATALALKQRGIDRVLVVEATDYRTLRIGESVPPDIRIVLGRLGLWRDFVADGHEPCLGSCSSWGADELGYNDFLFNPLGNGWHLDRRRFDAMLARKVVECGAVLRPRTRTGACEAAPDGFLLRLDGEADARREVSARFVVDASGHRTGFARNMGASRLFLDQLLSVTTFFDLCGADFTRLTMLEAVEYGWWYAAKLPDRRLAVAVASDPQIIRQLALRMPPDFLGSLARTRHIADAVAGSRLINGSLSICAAPSFALNRSAGERWLAVGDAASAYDPISSQGIHKALSDGIAAAEAIAAWFGGSTTALGDYQAAVAARFRHYRTQRDFFYGQEQRWPNSAFWTRRQPRIEAPAAALI